MPTPVDTISKTAEQAGAAMAVASSLTAAGGIAFMGQHWAPICGYGGLLLSIAGFIVNWRYQQIRLHHELRQKERRGESEK